MAPLSACSNAVLDPKYERNPQPQNKRVVTATIDGAPGTFAVANASVQYIIGPSQTCMPSAEPISGTFPTPERFSVSLPVRKLSDNVFEFDVYQDGMLDKDYFGKGVCTWVIEGLGLYLKARNAPNEREFNAYLSSQQILAPQPVVLYARRDRYGKATSTYDTDESALEERYASQRYGTDAGKLFKITLNAKDPGR